MKGTNDLWSGLNDNYIRVFVRASQDISNHIIPTRMTKPDAKGALGRVIWVMIGSYAVVVTVIKKRIRGGGHWQIVQIVMELEKLKAHLER